MVLTRQQRLLKACEKNNLQYLKNVFKRKLRKDKEFVKKAVCEKYYGLTLLIRACLHGCLKVVRYLVTVCGADVDQVADWSASYLGIEDASPLLCATRVGHYRIVKFLIAAGANLDSPNHMAWTPLRAATHFGHFQIFKLLVDKSADFGLASTHGEQHHLDRSSPQYQGIEAFLLWHAESKGHDYYRCVVDRYLLSIAKMTPDFFGSVADKIIVRFAKAIDEDHKNLQGAVGGARLLLEYIASKSEDNVLVNPVIPVLLLDQFWRVKSAHPEVQLKGWIAIFHDLVYLERHRRGVNTVLHVLRCIQPTVHPVAEFVSFLVNLGADVDARGVHGSTPLHWAACLLPVDTALVDSLVQHGAHIDLVKVYGVTAADHLPRDACGATPVCTLSMPVHYQTLQCLAANVVHTHRIPWYNNTALTQRAKEIIKQHL